MIEPAPLQQVGRTYVRQGRRVLSFFGGCDYFRFSAHPRILAAIHAGLERHGLNVAASRRTTGNHALYGQLESVLADFFQAESALLVNTGYASSIVAAQALAGEFSHALLDERAHPALQEAAVALGCPIFKFKHRDAGALAVALARCGPAARPLLLTDGMFPHDGSVAPVRAYLGKLPRDGRVLVDDAHGAGTLGEHGRGTVELEGVGRARVIQCVTLSKAFGIYGGAVVGSRALRRRIIARSQQFIGSTPLPLPLVAGALAAVKLMRRSAAHRRRLQSNTMRIRDALGTAGWNLSATPGPIVALPLLDRARTRQCSRALLAANILPPLLMYPGGPAKGYFRFVLSSEHTPEQINSLVRVLTTFDR